MQYLVIERFKEGKLKEVYRRFEENGRMMPEGLDYINSWITEDLSTCYQVMETDDISKLKEWVKNWDDLVDFEIINVITSQEAKQKVFNI